MRRATRLRGVGSEVDRQPLLLDQPGQALDLLLQGLPRRALSGQVLLPRRRSHLRAARRGAERLLCPFELGNLALGCGGALLEARGVGLGRLDGLAGAGRLRAAREGERR